MEVAIFGVGRIGQIHLGHLVDERRVRVTYLVDHEPVHETIKDLTQKHSLTDVTILKTEDAHMAIKDEKVKAIFVCTPVGQKVELITKGLQSGKHVFCEKPISLIKDEVESCYKMANDHGLTIQCGFNKRFDTSVRQLHDKIRQGELGQLRMIKLTARELPGLTWKEYLLSSGGIFIDTVVHEFDLMCWLAGERPRYITSFGHTQNQLFEECGDVDGAVILLKFSSGLMGFIESFRSVPYGYDQRFEVLGSDGMTVVTNPKITNIENWTKDSIHTSPIWQNGLTRYTEGYREEVRHFLDVVEGKCECTVKGDEVLLVHLLAECAARSMREGRVIEIPN
ncbi:uncharacterized protein LOC110463740 [Mizuhopecten yessoensis]|uniref:Oxidoreductase YrbE n=1 Tax=Mizuhopecten yessoensis TaxID=6573 RepID=A0A210PVK8_MIZYE|nr:uncharacterized protein LOC110463740 [Mizuhopecten yessoensis]OWF40492.1 oxidoreductase YrbE [Mizuhopecten yessoensis]